MNTQQRNDRLQVAVIIGSTRDRRFGPVPAHWIAEQARLRADLAVDVIDLREASLPDVIAASHEERPTTADDPAVANVEALSARLAAADAFIVVTPVYNRGYPGTLKNAIDWFVEEWAAKPVGFVSYGGAGGGIPAVEQLRQVFNEVHATTIREAMSFAQFWECFDTEGQPIRREATLGTAKLFLDRLTWWARALRTARTEVPYEV